MVSTGQFLYPPPGGTLTFNYRDTVYVSWETFQPNATECYLVLYYWDLVQGDAWRSSYNTTAAVNGSTPVDLNILGQSYYAQFNYNYTLEDGSVGLYLSSFFNVNYDSSQSPVTWGVSSSSTAASATSSTATRTSSTSSTTTSTSSSSSSPSSSTSAGARITGQTSPSSSATGAAAQSASGLSGGAIAGIAVGVILGVLGALGIAALLFFRRRRRATKQVWPPQMSQPAPAPKGPLYSELALSPPPGPASELSSERVYIELPE